MSTETETIRAQSQNLYYRQVWRTVVVESTWMFNKVCILWRRFSVNGSIQIAVPQKYQAAVLYNDHYAKQAELSGVWRVYCSFTKQHYWPHLPIDVHTLVSRGQSCKRHRQFGKHQLLLELFPVLGPLRFPAKNILWLLMRTKQRNHLKVVMTDRYSKLTWAVSLAKICGAKRRHARSRQLDQTRWSSGYHPHRQWQTVYFKAFCSSTRFALH